MLCNDIANYIKKKKINRKIGFFVKKKVQRLKSSLMFSKGNSMALKTKIKFGVHIKDEQPPTEAELRLYPFLKKGDTYIHLIIIAPFLYYHQYRKSVKERCSIKCTTILKTMNYFITASMDFEKIIRQNLQHWK